MGSILRQLLTLVMIICFTTTALAQDRSSLKSIIDEYNYALTVEWDQQDQGFLEQQNQRLESELNAILPKLSNQEILETFPELLILKREIQLQNLQSVDEVKDLILRNPLRYDRGASWDGTPLVVFGSILVLTILALRLSRDEQYECYSNNGTWSIWGCYYR